MATHGGGAVFCPAAAASTRSECRRRELVEPVSAATEAARPFRRSVEQPASAAAGGFGSGQPALARDVARPAFAGAAALPTLALAAPGRAQAAARTMAEFPVPATGPASCRETEFPSLSAAPARAQADVARAVAAGIAGRAAEHDSTDARAPDGAHAATHAAATPREVTYLGVAPLRGRASRGMLQTST